MRRRKWLDDIRNDDDVEIRDNGVNGDCFIWPLAKFQLWFLPRDVKSKEFAVYKANGFANRKDAIILSDLMVFGSLTPKSFTKDQSWWLYFHPCIINNYFISNIIHKFYH